MTPFDIVNQVCDKLISDHLGLSGPKIKAVALPSGDFQCKGKHKDAEYDFRRPTAAQAEDDANSFIEMVDRLERARRTA